MLYLQLFKTFFLIGLFSFGGGLASMELIRSRVVTQQHWLTNTEFTDIISISEMTPGPLGINIASFVGTRHRRDPRHGDRHLRLCPSRRDHRDDPCEALLQIPELKQRPRSSERASSGCGCHGPGRRGRNWSAPRGGTGWNISACRTLTGSPSPSLSVFLVLLRKKRSDRYRRS